MSASSPPGPVQKDIRNSGKPRGFLRTGREARLNPPHARVSCQTCDWRPVAQRQRRGRGRRRAHHSPPCDLSKPTRGRRDGERSAEGTKGEEFVREAAALMSDETESGGLEKHAKKNELENFPPPPESVGTRLGSRMRCVGYFGDRFRGVGVALRMRRDAGKLGRRSAAWLRRPPRLVCMTFDPSNRSRTELLRPSAVHRGHSQSTTGRRDVSHARRAGRNVCGSGKESKAERMKRYLADISKFPQSVRVEPERRYK